MLSLSNDLFDDRCPNEEKEECPRNFFIQSIQNEVKILDTDSNWNQLLYKEALNIERKDPALNKGLKASRQLKLFKWRKISYDVSLAETMPMLLIFNELYYEFVLV